jgi:hypothetical protein
MSTNEVFRPRLASASSGGMHRPYAPSEMFEMREMLIPEPTPKATVAKFSLKARVCIGGTAAVFLAVVLSLVLYFVTKKSPKPTAFTPYETACTVFCEGPVLQAIQTAKIWNDSKTFVDCPLTVDPSDAIAAFDAQFGGSTPTRDELIAFVAEYFTPAGQDTYPWVPDDFIWFPPVLTSLKNETLRSWALGLNDLWAAAGTRNSQRCEELPPAIQSGVGTKRHDCLWRTVSRDILLG